MDDEPTAVRPITSAADPALDAVESIYVDAIPPGGRKPLAWLRQVAGDVRPEPGGSVAGSSVAGSSTSGTAACRILVAERHRVAVGFAIVFLPANPSDASLLEYLAVARSARGTGIGCELLRECQRVCPGSMLIEIETTDADADRRRRFYERAGFRQIEYLQYILPLPDAPPMGLMTNRDERLDRETLARWIGTIYADVYGQRRDDPRVAEMLS